MAKKKKAQRGTLTFDDVREIAASMPEVEPARAWGCATFKANGTYFAAQPYPRRDVEPNSLGVSVSLEERARLLAAHPEVYYLTAHYEKYPGVLVRLSSIGRAELLEILTAAWHYAMAQPAKKTRPRRRKVSSK